MPSRNYGCPHVPHIVRVFEEMAISTPRNPSSIWEVLNSDSPAIPNYASGPLPLEGFLILLWWVIFPRLPLIIHLNLGKHIESILDPGGYHLSFSVEEGGSQAQDLSELQRIHNLPGKLSETLP